MSGIGVGEVFGRLTVVREARHGSRKGRRYLCVCDCGAETIINGSQLRVGHTTSCGCARNAWPVGHRATHRASKTREYNVWVKVKQRCLNAQCRDYQYYGGRGIRVCDRWRDSFEAFLGDMGHRPSEAHSLDRINNDGHYEPGNVRWATRSEQMRNSRRANLITFNGETHPLGVWAKRVGVTHQTLSMRLHHGWPIERAIGEEIAKATKH